MQFQGAKFLTVKIGANPSLPKELLLFCEKKGGGRWFGENDIVLGALLTTIICLLE